MKDILISIKNIFKYGRKTVAFTWLFFFIMSTTNPKHSIFMDLLLSGVFTFIIIIFAAVSKYLKLL